MRKQIDAKVETLTGYESLKKLIGIFSRHGIADRTQIAEHISFLLLAGHAGDEWQNEAEWPEVETALEDEVTGPLPKPPPLKAWEGQRPVDLIEVFRELLQSLGQEGDWGDFYQREARFQLLSSDRPGEYYPTPYHIADFMAQLILTPDAAGSVYDPTCGSAGLLVAARRYAGGVDPVGSDYNERWASLSVTNLYLNGVSKPRIEARSADSFRRVYEADHYEYVLMNPPFAAGVVSNLVDLAIDSMADNGRAAILVPSGVVQRDTERLLAHNSLEAVITLPPDAMQPYNGIRAHVLVLNKQQLRKDVWLASLLTDGYGSGRGRPLNLAQPPQPSELPRTLALVQTLRDDAGWSTVWEHEKRSIVLSQLNGGDEHPGGTAIQVRGAWESLPWQITQCGVGALVWLGDGGPEDASARLWVEYAKTGFALMDKADYRWTGIAEATLTTITNWEISVDYEAGGFKASVTLSDNGLKIGEYKLDYNANEQAANFGACLLDDEGKRISAWYWMNREEGLPEELTKAGQLLHGADGEPCAYLFSLTSGEENNASLLLTIGAGVQLWKVGEDGPGLMWQGEHTRDLWLLADCLRYNAGERVETSLQRADKQARGIAFGPNGDGVSGARLFAACLSEGVLSEQVTLEPERFLPKIDEPVVQKSPAQVLASIRQNQNQLSQRIDWLLQALSRGNGQPAAALPETATLEAELDERQADLWKHIQERKGRFIADDIVSWGKKNDVSEPEILQHLEILKLLGWIVPVHHEGRDKYRLVETSDLYGLSKE